MTIEPGVEQAPEVHEAAPPGPPARMAPAAATAPAPNPWVSKTIDLGTPVHYADFGGSGPVMILVHGIASSHLNWMGVGTELAQGARVYAVDLPGYGLSPRSPEPATVETSQHYLDRFIDAVSAQAPVIVFGHSMGGLVALMETAAHPEKVSRLILMSPAAPYPRRSLVSFFAFPFILAMLMPKRSASFLQKRGASLDAETVVRQALKRITARGARLPEDIVQAHIDLLNRQREEHDWTEQALIESAGSLVKTTTRRRAYRRLVHSVQAPTLLLHGSKDRLVPYQAGFRLAHERPDWTFRPLIGLGHMPQMEDATRVMSEVNQWLDRQATREVSA